jgi:hypothetical protein
MKLRFVAGFVLSFQGSPSNRYERLSRGSHAVSVKNGAVRQFYRAVYTIYPLKMLRRGRLRWRESAFSDVPAVARH